MASFHSKYLAANPFDLEWGLAVTTVGFQTIEAGSEYPPKIHPARYMFSTAKGRVLNEFQLLYITEGSGEFSSRTLGRNRAARIEKGMMFLLFPGEWHSYNPDRETGWKEFWIGFNGSFVENIVKKGFITKEKPIFNVRMSEKIVDLYKEAVSVADAQESGFQQVLAGIAHRLLTLALYNDRNTAYEEASELTDKMKQAKVLIYDEFAGISPVDIAKRLCLSYSTFRKSFKETTGMSPAKFINDIRMKKARELLTDTNIHVKEVAYMIGFKNPDYFFTAFRSLTGMTPAEYRKMAQGGEP